MRTSARSGRQPFGLPSRWRDPETERHRAVLAAVAPGTVLRDAIERVIRGRTGALLVLGFDDSVEALCSGGFALDVKLSATRIRELAKMDGAIVVDCDHQRIVRAAVHLVPDPHIPTDESGTRHRTAERVAKQTGHPVISVSQSMHMVALYVDDRRFLIEEPTAILTRANQALATLEQYRQRVDEVSGTLSALEIEDLATVSDVASVVQRLEMVRRIADEIEGYVTELGSDGRLLALQLQELARGCDSELEFAIRDYPPPTWQGEELDTDHHLDTVLDNLDRLAAGELLEVRAVAAAMGFTDDTNGMERPVTPRGFRLLAKVPRLPESVITRLVAHFGDLQKLLATSVADLRTIEGIGESRARAVREGLTRLAESYVLDRYT